MDIILKNGFVHLSLAWMQKNLTDKETLHFIRMNIRDLINVSGYLTLVQYNILKDDNIVILYHGSGVIK